MKDNSHQLFCEFSCLLEKSTKLVPSWALLQPLCFDQFIPPSVNYKLWYWSRPVKNYTLGIYEASQIHILIFLSDFRIMISMNASNTGLAVSREGWEDSWHSLAGAGGGDKQIIWNKHSIQCLIAGKLGVSVYSIPIFGPCIHILKGFPSGLFLIFNIIIYIHLKFFELVKDFWACNLFGMKNTHFPLLLLLLYIYIYIYSLSTYLLFFVKILKCLDFVKISWTTNKTFRKYNIAEIIIC